LSGKWESNGKLCRSLVERNDLLQAEKVKTYDDLHKSLEDMRSNTDKTHNPMAVLILLPAISQIQSLTVIFTKFMSNNPDTSLTWGLAHVAVRQCTGIDWILLDRFAEMIKDIGQNAYLLVEYDRRGFAPEAMKSAVIDFKIELDRFLAYFIQSIHNVYQKQSQEEREYLMAISFDSLNFAVAKEGALKPLEAIYGAALSRIGIVIESLQKLAGLANLNFPDTDSVLSSVEYLGITDSDRSSDLRCVVLPTVKNPRFFGRKNELEAIDTYLSASSKEHGLRSLAIHGLGGVGKTQIALAYAYSKIAEYDAILWVHAETEVSLSSSLSSIALQLKIPSAEPGNATNNVVLTLNWLANTGMQI
jgi:hypothetical protein